MRDAWYLLRHFGSIWMIEPLDDKRSPPSRRTMMSDLCDVSIEETGIARERRSHLVEW